MFEAAPVVLAAMAVARSINVLSATFSTLCKKATFLIASGGVSQAVRRSSRFALQSSLTSGHLMSAKQR
jgi:hypothetical protein